MTHRERASLGLLVMAYGGPNNLDEVAPYLLDVRGGRPTSEAITHEVRERYRAIGGRSPILERTRAQADVLQAALPEFRAYVGMRHWHPYIDAAMAQMAADGITRAVGLVMAPHYSRMSIGAYFKKVEQAGAALEVAPIERWGLLPGYLDALAQRVRDALERCPADTRDSVPVIFTAHSLPERIREWDDPYPAELRATVEGVMERLGPRPHTFAYQSAAIRPPHRSGGQVTPEPWLGPDAGQVIGQLAAEGQRSVLIAPIGFVTEHVEIMYDVDVEFQRQASELGVRLERIDMLNTAAPMIAGLAGLVRETARQKGWL